MISRRVKIKNIPALLWGENTDKIFIYVHGKLSCKEDAESFAEQAAEHGYCTLSFDLAEHGERKNDEDYPCTMLNGAKDLNAIWEWVSERYKNISVFACSMGAYLSLLVFKNTELKKCLFLSPILDMKQLVDGMMFASGISTAELEERKIIETQFETLYWDDYRYISENPIDKWVSPTEILYGSKDNLTPIETVRAFCGKFGSGLSVLENSEHYFHTPEQLEALKKWTKKNLSE